MNLLIILQCPHEGDHPTDKCPAEEDVEGDNGFQIPLADGDEGRDEVKG